MFVEKVPNTFEMRWTALALMFNTSDKLFQCVPNFSEGRNSHIVESIVGAIADAGVRLIDWSMDWDHNRSVVTFVGNSESVRRASIAAAAVAAKTIDIRQHIGVHPRIGALDVLPFVPLLNCTVDDCVELAHEVGQELFRSLSIPVYYYDFASPSGVTLPEVRKGAFKEIVPDVGNALPHPRAGAVAVSARTPLIAFNVNLLNASLPIVRQIARELRFAFPDRVRALGFWLESRGLFQVSTNIIRPDLVGPEDVVDFVGRRSTVAGCELIGAIPGFSAFHVLKDALLLDSLRPEQILLENWNTNSRLYE